MLWKGSAPESKLEQDENDRVSERVIVEETGKEEEAEQEVECLGKRTVKEAGVSMKVGKDGLGMVDNDHEVDHRGSNTEKRKETKT